MTSKASITVMRPREDVERLWQDPRYRPDHIDTTDAVVRFIDAPGDRGTEIHVELKASPRRGKLAAAVQNLRGSVPLAWVKDDLWHFKQRAETGVIARSEAVPEGERLQRKFKRRPAQPLRADELSKAGV